MKKTYFYIIFLFNVATAQQQSVAYSINATFEETTSITIPTMECYKQISWE
jgi:hypothetical protein